jgi:hypothetical protein
MRSRARLVASISALLVACGFVVAARGGASGPGVASERSTTTTIPISGFSNSSAWSAARVLKYSECMRGHGVTNFPEPGSGGVNVSGTRIDFNSAIYKSAEAKCFDLMPGGPSKKAQATEQQITLALETTQCMRDHGVPNFPDPVVTPTPPARGSDGPGLTEYNNGILIHIPTSIDVNAAAFQEAAKDCDFNTGFPASAGGGL